MVGYALRAPARPCDALRMRGVLLFLLPVLLGACATPFAPESVPVVPPPSSVLRVLPPARPTGPLTIGPGPAAPSAPPFIPVPPPRRPRGGIRFPVFYPGPPPSPAVAA